MGDRFDRRSRPGQSGSGQSGASRLGARLMHTRGKPPPTILAWGIGQPASIGHNNGPPLDVEQPGYLWRRYRWTKAHAAAWKTPSMAVLKFRVARAEAAGMDYRDYMSALLDTGRFLQARDRDVPRVDALAKVRSAWTRVIPRLAPSAPRMQSAIILSSLTAAYDDPTRAYHNLVHIAAVLDELSRHGGAANDQDALAVAALFHDMIYDATRGDNEAASAHLACLHMTDLGVAAPRVALIEGMIRATRHSADDVAAADADTALLLDCDLAVLAAPRARYLSYAAAVRREYSHVPDAAFRQGRAKILAGFLTRPRLYATPALAALWEGPARANIAAEIAALTASA